MIEFLQITNDPAIAARCDALPGMRIFLDLERNGKAERQAGRSTFISAHCMEDIAPVKTMLKHAQLMVRVNPLHDGTLSEVNAALEAGADLLMLPMFRNSEVLGRFSRIVGGRCPIVALLETREALNSITDWIETPGLWEVFVGLNDLHLSMGRNFMFEPLAQGLLDRVAAIVHRQGLRFGFGGIARLDEGLLPGRDVLSEHLRLGSRAVILSRTFRDASTVEPLDAQIAALRTAEAALALRSSAQVEADRQRIHAAIEEIARRMKAAA